MANSKRRLNPLTPILVMLVAWLVKKSAKKAKKAVAVKRGTSVTSKPEEILWKVGLGLALAGAEALVTSLLNKSDADQEASVRHQERQDNL